MNRRQFIQNALKAAAVVPVVGIVKLTGEPQIKAKLFPDALSEYSLGMPGDVRLAGNIVWENTGGAWVTPVDYAHIDIGGEQKRITLYEFED